MSDEFVHENNALKIKVIFTLLVVVLMVMLITTVVLLITGDSTNAADKVNAVCAQHGGVSNWTHNGARLIGTCQNGDAFEIR